MKKLILKKKKQIESTEINCKNLSIHENAFGF